LFLGATIGAAQAQLVATGIVAYSMLVAGFVMLGAKLNQRFGALQVFRAAVLLFGGAQVVMTFSPDATFMIAAQVLCGTAGAVIVPRWPRLLRRSPEGPRTSAKGAEQIVCTCARQRP
jgi:predicted MFS family arabinose efflux permease